MQTHEKVTQDAFTKMEELVALNDDLMKVNQTLQAQAQTHYEDLNVQEQQVQKLQSDLNFYMTKNNQLEQQLLQINSQLDFRNVSAFSNNNKPSNSLKSSHADPKSRSFIGTSPMEKLKPHMKGNEMRHSGMRSTKSPIQKQYEREVKAPAAHHDQIQSQPGRGRQPGHRQGQGKTQYQRHDMSGVSPGAAPIEEGSKLNMLIDEYRKENDRCSKRINELQKKLNKSAGR